MLKSTNVLRYGVKQRVRVSVHGRSIRLQRDQLMCINLSCSLLRREQLCELLLC